MDAADSAPAAYADVRFCAACGGVLRPDVPPGDDRLRAVCSLCRRVTYFNPRPVAMAVIERGGRVLLARRAIEPGYGRWTCPGGFAELGETPEQTAERETREECGLRVRIGAQLGAFARSSAAVVVLAFRAWPLERRAPRASAETLEVRWFAPDAIPWDQIAFDSTAEALQAWLARRRARRARPSQRRT